MKRSSLALLVLASLSIFAGRSDATYAITLPDNVGNFSLGAAETVGDTFTINANVSITSLGIYDNISRGLVNPHTLGLYDSTGNLLTSVVTPTGNPATVGGFAYMAITPQLLLAGQTYTIAATYASQDPDQFVFFGANPTIDPTLTFKSSQVGIGAGLVYPTTTVSTTTGIYGPSFVFNAVPEPSAYVLLGVGLAGLAGVRLLNRRSAA